MKENETNATLRPVFNISLRYIKEDLDELMTQIDRVSEKIEDKDLQLSLDIARDQVEEVYNEIVEREDKVEGLIKSIAS